MSSNHAANASEQLAKVARTSLPGEPKAASGRSQQPTKISRKERALMRARKKADKRRERRQRVTEKNREVNAASSRAASTPPAREPAVTRPKGGSPKLYTSPTEQTTPKKRAPYAAQGATSRSPQPLMFALVLVAIGLFVWFLARRS